MDLGSRTFDISADMITRIINHLSKYPWKDVDVLIKDLMKEVNQPKASPTPHKVPNTQSG